MLCAAGLLATACGGGSDGGSSAASGSGSGSKDLGTLNVVTAVPNSLLFIGVEAADQLHTWDGTGLKVNVINGTSENAGQLMAGGQADIGLIDGPRAASNIQKGLDAKVVAPCIAPWTQYVIASAKSGATTISDLKGKTWGTSGAGSAGDYSAYMEAKHNGWGNDYKTVALGKLDALRAALTSGSIDAFAWSSTTAFALEESGAGKVIESTQKAVGPNIFEAFTVMNKVLKDRPDAVKAFFEGYFAAIKKLQANPQQAVDILVNQWKVDPTAAKRAVDADLKNLSTDGTASDADLKGLADATTFSTKQPAPDPKAFWQYWKDAVKA